MKPAAYRMPLQTESRQIKQQTIIGPFLWETSLWTEPDLSVHLIPDPQLCILYRTLRRYINTVLLLLLIYY